MSRKPFYAKIVLQESLTEDLPGSGLFSRKQPRDLYSLLRTLEAARTNRRVRAVLLVIRRLSAGWAQIEELRRAIHRLRRDGNSGGNTGGKIVVAFLESATNKTYALAAAADQLLAPPTAFIDLVGLRAELFFFRRLLDKLGVQPQLLSLGAYKSAAEIFQRESPSPESREMTESILADLQDRMISWIRDDRGVSAEKVREWIDGGPYSARQALQAGLIDGLHYEDELEELFRRRIPKISELAERKLAPREGWIRRLFIRRPEIALLVAEGLISSGESRRGRGTQPVLGSETFAQFLREARRRKRVQAVVLRINSPGGSGLASDLIWREVDLTREVKPVMVSFGDVAASGGYYIAAAGGRIFSNATTLTGSIGAISGKFNLRPLMERFGIGCEAIDCGQNAGHASLVQAFSDQQEAKLKAHLTEFYEHDFLEKVSRGRGKDPEAIRRVAAGRVWTGAQAERNGLVDQLGGLQEAFEAARQEAKLREGKKFRVIRYTRRRGLWDLLSLPFTPFAEIGFPDAIQALWWDELEIK